MGQKIDATAILEKIKATKIVPLIALDTVKDGLKVCEILNDNGLPVLEITFRTDAAEETIREAAKQFPDMLIGAGTVLNTKDVERAYNAGAKFAVSPGLNPKVVCHAQKVGLPFYPGICNPTDVEAALDLGLTTLKYFPAEAAGGVKMLKAMSAPYKHLGVKFLPTGGITPQNMTSYLELPEVLSIGGTWIANKDLIQDQNWDAIKKNTVEALEIAHK